MDEARAARIRAIEAGEGDWVETPSADEEQEVGKVYSLRVSKSQCHSEDPLLLTASLFLDPTTPIMAEAVCSFKLSFTLSSHMAEAARSFTGPGSVGSSDSRTSSGDPQPGGGRGSLRGEGLWGCAAGRGVCSVVAQRVAHGEGSISGVRI